jgi:hypothetical protein
LKQVYDALPLESLFGKSDENIDSQAATDYNNENAADIAACKKWRKSDAEALNKFKDVMGILGDIELDYDCSGVCV